MSPYKILLIVMMSFAGVAHFGYGKKQQTMSAMIADGLMMLVAFPVVWSRM